MTSSEKLHLAIIPDGNRRWAREKGFLEAWKGHERAVDNFRMLADWCQHSGRVHTLTIWCFSTENWKRASIEVEMLMKMFESFLQKEQQGFLDRGIRFVHSGRRDRLPKSLVRKIEETEAMTNSCTTFTLHLAVDYGGKDEVVRAVQRMTENGVLSSSFSEDVIAQHLDHPELLPIDIILRSSGEQRTSNFCLWQAAYSEWVFNPKHFPEITVDDLSETVDEFYKRKRRFGG
jgi:undecaprenyl diphosphate synthase